MTPLKILVAGLVVVLLIGACSKKKANIDVVDKIVVSENVPDTLPPVEIKEESQVAIEKVVDLAELSPVLFDFDSYTLSNESLQRLAGVARTLQANPKMNVLITGATCPIGTYEYNLALGQARAEACASYLANLEIDARRVTTKSVGEEGEYLITTEKSEYWKNRRSEFSAQFTEQ